MGENVCELAKYRFHGFPSGNVGWALLHMLHAKIKVLRTVVIPRNSRKLHLRKIPAVWHTSASEDQLAFEKTFFLSQERGFTSGTTTKIDPTGTTPTRSSHMTGIGKAGSSFGGVSKQAKSSGIVVTQEVCDAVEAVKSDKTETDWYVSTGDFSFHCSLSPPLFHAPLLRKIPFASLS